MEDNFEQGLDGGIEETKETSIDIPQKATRQPYFLWSVSGQDYKLKLTSSAICKLEQKYKKNLLLLITADGVPPLSVMLTTIQAGMLQYHHGIKYTTVQFIYDSYVDAGGDQMKLLTEVVMPLMGVSGFFTENQMETLTEGVKDMDSEL